MTVFDDARQEWQNLLSQTSWASPVFGDTYYIRYPIDIGTQEALTYKQSVFKGDDDVHAFDAKAVRQKIIQRLIEAQERKLKPWFGQVSYFADNMKFLPPLPEQELDFVIRNSLFFEDNQIYNVPFRKARENLLYYLDPEVKPSFSTECQEMEQAIIYSKCQIEMYGLFNIIKDKVFILSDGELREIIDLLLNIEKSDKILVKRFIEAEKEFKPFIGQGNLNLTRESNFLLEYIAGGDPEFYPFRVFQLWIRNLLDFDKTAIDYIEKEKSHIFNEFSIDKIKDVLLLSIKLFRWMTIKERLLSQIKNEYASKKDFSGYTTNFIHLMHSRIDLFKTLDIDEFKPPIEKSEYDSEYISHQIALATMSSVINYLTKQIPEPEGVDRIQARLIVNKRVKNLEKYVLPDEFREEIQNEVKKVDDFIEEPDSELQIEQILRIPYNKIYPRGEYYFKQMEAEVKLAMEKAGDRDLRKELAEITDDPQTLVKQYGSPALKIVENPEDLKEVYSTILALKSAELIFSNHPNLTVMKRQQIIKSLINDLFAPQFDFLRIIKTEGEIKELTLEEEN